MPKVDVALCVYGRPYNTAVTLASLLRHSGHRIGRILLQEDGTQPFGETVDYLSRCFPGVEIDRYIPPVRIGHDFVDTARILRDDAYRLSLRYQKAWEDSAQDFLFVTHNDCLFTSDIISEMAAAASDVFVGVGQIGQCWNCPAAFAELCSGSSHEDFKPSYEEAIAVVRAHPGPRTPEWSIQKDRPMPFPECRLNEFACLISLKALRGEVAPVGDILPFGSMSGDIGTSWFRALRLAGYRFLDYGRGFRHAPFSDSGAGNPSQRDHGIYQVQEARARDYLRTHYPKVFDRLTALRLVTRTLKGLETEAAG
ncbi:hypothetical protein [Acidisoma silvae]|uniref:Uncharacterized protein n=1 Tax=Acidisoma silvae TaxID=2802396 RepID=A0A963YST5_9PROT|nr:hypothetical protein [Acidisoma silvae]MCB8876367.1 hypothetical protein [Acidisoma silvae]